MKKLVYNAVMAALVAATTLMNTANVTAANPADTVKADSTNAVVASPEADDYAVVEAALPVEDWMYENINLLNEETINVEGWMTESVNLLNEETLNVESWMTEDVDLLNEETLNVESWMSEDIDLLNEEELKVAAWMF